MVVHSFDHRQVLWEVDTLLNTLAFTELLRQYDKSNGQCQQQEFGTPEELRTLRYRNAWDRVLHGYPPQEVWEALACHHHKALDWSVWENNNSREYQLNAKFLPWVVAWAQGAPGKSEGDVSSLEGDILRVAAIYGTRRT